MTSLQHQINISFSSWRWTLYIFKWIIYLCLHFGQPPWWNAASTFTETDTKVLLIFQPVTFHTDKHEQLRPNQSIWPIYHLLTLWKLFSFPSSSAESHFHAAPVHKGATWLDCCDDYFAISLCCISLGLIDRRTPSLFPAALLGISAGLNQSFQTWDPVNRAGKSLRWEQLWTTVSVLYCVCVSVCFD